MKRCFILLRSFAFVSFFLLIFSVGAALSPQNVLADAPDCVGVYTTGWPNSMYWLSPNQPFNFVVEGLRPSTEYNFSCFSGFGTKLANLSFITSDSNGKINSTLTGNACSLSTGNDPKEDTLVRVEMSANGVQQCTLLRYNQADYRKSLNCSSTNFAITYTAPDNCLVSGKTAELSVNPITYKANPSVRVPKIKLSIQNGLFDTLGPNLNQIDITDGEVKRVVIRPGQNGKDLVLSTEYDGCNISIPVYAKCGVEPISPPGTNAEFALCNQAADAPKTIGAPGGPEFTKCNQCLCGQNVCKETDVNTKYAKKIWTAFGCINVAPAGIVGDFIKIAMGISGGVMLLTILAGAFLLATSAGDPKKVQEAQEMISQTIVGFLFFLFSVVILRFIVVSILKIPAF